MPKKCHGHFLLNFIFCYLYMLLPDEPDVSVDGFDGNWYLNRENVQLSCQADANPPVSLYQWRLWVQSLFTYNQQENITNQVFLDVLYWRLSSQQLLFAISEARIFTFFPHKWNNKQYNNCCLPCFLPLWLNFLPLTRRHLYLCYDCLPAHTTGLLLLTVLNRLCSVSVTQQFTYTVR